MPSSLWFFKDNNDNIAYAGTMKLASCKIGIMGTAPNGSSLSHEPAFFAIINGFALGLTKRLTNTVSAMFLGKGRYWSIYTFLLADRGVICSPIP
jgi:hypothetical protein